MRLPLNWLREYVSIDAGDEEIAVALDSAGFEVERVIRLDEGIRDVLVARVATIEAHPDADRLRVCVVEVGDGEQLNVVCGASNFGEGDLVAFARAGAELPGGLLLARRKIRGVVSEGMICSEEELGLAAESDGIMCLQVDGTAEKCLGMPLADVLGLDETVLELDITPNRPDAMSVIGLAREAAAAFGTSYHLPEFNLEEGGTPTTELVHVENAAPDLCPRYTARVVEGVKIAPSPQWLVEKLTASGVRAINNVVDITNFVLLETGQPLHAFDLDKVNGGRVVVRRAEEGEEIETLDGASRRLTRDDLVIADAERATALAGIMGGADSEITEATTRVLIESAYFDPVSILKTSKRTGLRSESSSRFERGCDPEMAAWASDRATSLLANLAGGSISTGLSDDYPHPVARREVPLRPERAEKILGIELSGARQAEMLASIDFDVIEVSDETISVSAPTFRPDIEREIDLIEEIGRMYGYSRIEATLPASPSMVGGLTREQRLRRSLREALRAAGLDEVQTFSFVGPDDLLAESTAISRVANPLRAEESILRPSLLPGLIKVASMNIARRRGAVAIFECGKVFGPLNPDGMPEESARVAGLIATDSPPDETSGYSRMKGVVEILLEALGVEDATFEPAERPGLHPGRTSQLKFGEMPAGILAELHPRALERFGLGSGSVFVIDEALLLDGAADFRAFTEFSRFPLASVDLAFQVDEEVPSAAVEGALRDALGSALETCELFDIFRGEQIGEGRKSLAYSIGLSSLDHTLADDEVAALRERAIDAVRRECGGELRGG